MFEIYTDSKLSNLDSDKQQYIWEKQILLASNFQLAK